MHAIHRMWEKKVGGRKKLPRYRHGKCGKGLTNKTFQQHREKTAKQQWGRVGGTGGRKKKPAKKV